MRSEILGGRRERPAIAEAPAFNYSVAWLEKCATGCLCGMRRGILTRACTRQLCRVRAPRSSRPGLPEEQPPHLVGSIRFGQTVCMELYTIIYCLVSSSGDFLCPKLTSCKSSLRQFSRTRGNWRNKTPQQFHPPSHSSPSNSLTSTTLNHEPSIPDRVWIFKKYKTPQPWLASSSLVVTSRC